MAESGIRTRGTFDTYTIWQPLLSTTQPSPVKVAKLSRLVNDQSKSSVFHGWIPWKFTQLPTVFDIEIFAPTIVRLITQILSSLTYSE